MSSIVCTEKIIQCKQQNTRSRIFYFSEQEFCHSYQENHLIEITEHPFEKSPLLEQLFYYLCRKNIRHK